MAQLLAFHPVHNCRGQRTDIGKYSFVNRTIEDWNQLPAEVLRTLPCKQNNLKKMVRKVITQLQLINIIILLL
jgi:hypothetical protein